MDNTLINKIIDELKSELKLKYPDFRGIYFFGSRARGDFNKYSDYDLAFVFSRDIDRAFDDEISSIICKYDRNYDVLIDNQTFDINDLLEPITPFRVNIVKEGIFYEV
jgi:predicted nucleotidyltransferase